MPASPRSSALLVWLIGIGPFLAIHLPIAMLAASIGVWLFYVQHQFEETAWAHEPAWSHPEAALHGSFALRSAAGAALVHRQYRRASRASSQQPHPVSIASAKSCAIIPSLSGIGRLTLWQSLRCIRFALWDESAKRLVSFGALRRAKA